MSIAESITICRVEVSCSSFNINERDQNIKGNIKCPQNKIRNRSELYHPEKKDQRETYNIRQQWQNEWAAWQLG